MKLISVLLLFLSFAVHADERDEAAILGFSSATGLAGSELYLKNWKKQNAEKFRRWEAVDKKLQDAMERKLSLENSRERQFYKALVTSGEFDRRSYTAYHKMEVEYLKSLEELNALERAASRSRAIDFILGVFVGERRQLMNRLIMGNLGRITFVATGLTALYREGAILSGEFSAKANEVSATKTESPNVAAAR